MTSDQPAPIAYSESQSVSEESLREVLDSAPVLIWISDGARQGIWFNATWLTFTGQTDKAARGDGWMGAIHPEEMVRFLASCSMAFSTKKPCSVKHRLRRRRPRISLDAQQHRASADPRWRAIRVHGLLHGHHR
ncbi:MAG: PAS domain-containing protein [Armatimonas sp.]